MDQEAVVAKQSLMSERSGDVRMIAVARVATRVAKSLSFRSTRECWSMASEMIWPRSSSSEIESQDL